MKKKPSVIKPPTWCSHPTDQILDEDKKDRVMRCVYCGDPIISFDQFDKWKGLLPGLFVSRFMYSFHTAIARIEF